MSASLWLWVCALSAFGFGARHLQLAYRGPVSDDAAFIPGLLSILGSLFTLGLVATENTDRFRTLSDLLFLHLAVLYTSAEAVYRLAPHPPVPGIPSGVWRDCQRRGTQRYTVGLGALMIALHLILLAGRAGLMPALPGPGFDVPATLFYSILLGTYIGATAFVEVRAKAACPQVETTSVTAPSP